MSFSRVALVGDAVGLPVLLEHVPSDRIACIVVAEIRERPESVVGPLAREGVPVLTQPRRRSDAYAAFGEAFARLQPDLLLCNSYAMKVGPDILALVSGNAINAHAALLPKNRGPNPIQWAILRGDSLTGVTLHYMVDEIDAGDIVAQRAVPITDCDSWLTVRDRVNTALRDLIATELPGILAGTNPRTPQDAASATVNPRLTPDSPRIDFERMTDEAIYNLVRAQVHPLAGAYLDLPDGHRRRFTEMLTREEVVRLRRDHA